MYLTDCEVMHNNAGGYYGGDLDNRGNAILTSTTISSNNAGDKGGGVNNHGQPT